MENSLPFQKDPETSEKRVITSNRASQPRGETHEKGLCYTRAGQEDQSEPNSCLYNCPWSICSWRKSQEVEGGFVVRSYTTVIPFAVGIPYFLVP